MPIAKFDLYNAEWLDLVFDHRNKEYGAYELRQHYGQTMSKAMGLTFAGIAVIAISAFIFKGKPPELVKMTPVELTTTLIQPPVAPPKKVEPPKSTEPPKPVEPLKTVANLPPVVCLLIPLCNHILPPNYRQVQLEPQTVREQINLAMPWITTPTQPTVPRGLWLTIPYMI